MENDNCIAFMGAAQNVTGSCYLLRAGGKQVLIDCGMYQEREFKARNWEPLPFHAKSLDAVILTHAHLDHCGLLPKLVKEGYQGPIYCTSASADITEIILLDSAKIQVEDAEKKIKRHAKKKRKPPHPVTPLYTVDDVARTTPLLRTINYEQSVSIGNALEFSLHDAGHILGSASVCIHLQDGKNAKTILFSGDIGRWNSPLLRDPTLFDEADHIVMESTYGNRSHESNDDIEDVIARVVTQTYRAGGNLIIPSFAVERAQEVLYFLGMALRDEKIERLPVFLDSPMAVKVTDVFRRHPEIFDERAIKLMESGHHPCDFPALELCRTVQQSKDINKVETSSIIIAGSGMCTGGRIKHHLVSNIGRSESTILFVGYQAVGTLGRLILEGAKEVRILGEQYAVRANVDRINGFSGHADREELLKWLSGLKRPPTSLSLTHGEPDASAALAASIKETYAFNVSLPSWKDTLQLVD